MTETDQHVSHMVAVRTIEDCRSVVRAVFPELRVERVRFLAEGWDSCVFEIEDGVVFRFPKRKAVDQTLQTEIRLLPELAPLLPIPIPKFMYVSGPVGNHPWHAVGYQKLIGEPLHDIPLTPEIVAEIAPQLAAFLKALHEFPVGRAQALDVPMFSPEQWLDRHKQLVTSAHGIIRDQVDARTAGHFEAFWEKVFADPSSTRYTPTLIHGDLSAEHVLIADRQVTGVIDFGDAMVADLALDFAGFTNPVAWAILGHYDRRRRQGLWNRRRAYVHAVPLHAIAAGRELGLTELVQQGLLGIRHLSEPRLNREDR